MPYDARTAPQLNIRDDRYQEVQVSVVGGDDSLTKVYSFNEWLALNIPRYSNSTLPISVFCPTLWDVREINTLAPFFASLTGLDPAEQVRRLDDFVDRVGCRDRLTRPWKWWVVFNSRSNMRFMANKWTLVAPFTDGYNNAMSKRSNSLLDALKLVLLDGETLEQVNLRNEALRAVTTAFSAVSLNPSASTTTPASARPETPPPMYTATPAPTPTHTRVGNALPSTLRVHPPPATLSNSTESHQLGEDSDSDVEVIGYVQRARSTRVPTTPSNRVRAHPQNAPSTSRGRRVRLHRRDIYGNIVSTLFDSPPSPAGFVPSLGDNIDHWCDSHGLDDTFVVLLYSALQATDDFSVFDEAISEYLPQEEAYWVWSSVEYPLPNVDRERDFERAVTNRHSLN